MATEVPFGLTFGNPSKYIGSSGIGQAVKTGLVAYGMQKSGLTSFLNDLGKKTPDGSVPPITSGAAGDMNTNGIWGTNPLPVQPPNFGSQTSEATSEVNPSANGMAGAVSPDMAPAPGVTINPIPDAGFPSDIGHQLLDGNDNWQHSAVNPQAQRDSLVLPQQQTIEPPQLTGNEYKQAPGYGKLQKVASAMMGMG